MRANLSTKMIGYFLLVVLVAAIGFGYTVWKVNDISNIVEKVNNVNLPLLLETSQVNNNTSDAVASIRGYFITKNPELLNDFKKKMSESATLEDHLLQGSVTPEGKRLGTEVKAAHDKYMNIAEQKVIPLIQANQGDAAQQVMINELTPAAKELNNKLDKYQELRNQQIGSTLTEAVGHAHQTKMTAIFVALLAAILGVVIGFLAARNIAGPVNKLVGMTKKIAEGDLTQHIAINRQDEIGQLAGAVNAMVSHLQGLIKQITANAEHVAASSEELTASSEQSTQATNQIATSINSVATGATTQLEAVASTSAVVEQMSAGIQQIAANSNELASQSVQAASEAQEGNGKVDQAVQQIKQVENTVNASAQVVARLGERSKEIGEIVDTISGIAGQTNLLALNAAIEAARAGEQGKGFAVVAEEVRKLAEQSQEAAQKIAELISEIQGETTKAVEAMNHGTEEVKVGTQVVGEAGAAFKTIINVVTHISDQTKEVSAAIQQMATGSQQIVDSVRKIGDLSKESAGESQSVSAATEEQLASMEEIANSSQALAQLAQNLQSEVTKFRV